MADYDETIRQELARRGHTVKHVHVYRHVSEDARLSQLALGLECVGEMPVFDLLEPLEIFDDAQLRDWITLRFGPRPGGIPASTTA